MNLTVIDVSDIENLSLEDEVIVYSENREDKNSIENSSKIAGTIQYKILTGIVGDIRRILL